MTKFVCKNCKYNFEAKAVPPRCPYCDREKTLEKEKSAAELVDEIGAMLD